MFTITTPAILFPAISLILLAYTAKMIHLGELLRRLKQQFIEDNRPEILAQILNLKRRIYLIRNMQASGCFSFFFCVACMFLLLAGKAEMAKVSFGLSLICLLISLFLSLREILISTNALKIVLEELEEEQ